MATQAIAANESFFDRIRNGFTSNYWIANSLELFERFAFYGSKAVLSFYLANTLQLGPEQGASLAGLFSFLVYFLPAGAGVLVDRYGFRKMLALCFALFSVGYFLIGFAAMPAAQGIVSSMGKLGYITTVLVLTAIGGSLIKPCIVGTVERTSKPGYRDLGFSIYYSIVNLGGAIGPVLASPVRSEWGIQWVFIISSITSAIMVFGALFFFKEPVPHDGKMPERRTLGATIAGMAKVFTNLRFMLFLLIFSGFYVMFWQIFYSFPFYVDEVLKFKRFEILESVDAWTIIIFSVAMTAVTKKLSAMSSMVIGFLIASASWLIMALLPPSIEAAIAALVVFAIGESICAPRYYDYVGSLAPKDQVATYMGVAFVPVAVGSLIAGKLGGKLAQMYIRDAINTERMWIIIAGIGFVTTALLYAYHKLLGEQKRDARAD